jgi:hypothetical protein
MTTGAQRCRCARRPLPRTGWYRCWRCGMVARVPYGAAQPAVAWSRAAVPHMAAWSPALSWSPGRNRSAAYGTVASARVVAFRPRAAVPLRWSHGRPARPRQGAAWSPPTLPLTRNCQTYSALTSGNNLYARVWCVRVGCSHGAQVVRPGAVSGRPRVHDRGMAAWSLPQCRMVASARNGRLRAASQCRRRWSHGRPARPHPGGGHRRRGSAQAGLRRGRATPGGGANPGPLAPAVSAPLWTRPLHDP